MFSNPNAFRVYSGICPDPGCRTRLYFPSYAASSVECTGCGQHHTKDTLLNVELVQDPEVAIRNLLHSALLTRTALKKEAELVRVKGYSNYHCKLLAPLLTKYGMDRNTGKAKLLKEMGQGESFDCSHVGNRAFAIEPELLETAGYGRDSTGSVDYLSDTLAAVKAVNNGEDTLVPIHVDGDGHCLVHAISRALIGREVFWHALRTNLNSHLLDNLPKYMALFRDFIHSTEWTGIINEADPDYQPPEGQQLGLTNIHIFGLANVLHRPILLLDKLAGMQSSGDYSGTFLPALVPVHACKSKDGKLYPPLAIAWSSSGRNHYIPLVGIASKPAPKIPKWLIPKAWGIPNDLVKSYIGFDENDCCVIGGDHSLQEKYIQRLMKAMDEQFLEMHSIAASLVTEVHQFLYKSSGFVGVQAQTVIESTQQSVKAGHLRRCLSCHAVSKQLPAVSEEWLQPGGEMYKAAAHTQGGLIDGQMYTFPQQEVVCSYDGEKDVLLPVKYKGALLSECTLCKGSLRHVRADGSAVYVNGDTTTTPVQGHSQCNCGYKHFWEGKEYDNLPEVIPVTLEWGGKTIKETVHWFQNEPDVTMNSNVYAVASKVVQKYFPGEFGSERLVQKVVDTILRQTARKEGDNKGARPDIPNLAPIPSPSSSQPDGAAIDKYVPSKIILTGEKKKTFHKEELTMSEAERIVRARTEHHAAVMQKRRSGEHGLKKTPEKVPTPPKLPKDKQAASPSTPTKQLANQPRPSTPNSPLSPRADKKIRLSSSKGGQAMLTLPLNTTYRQLQEAIHRELDILPEHQKIRYGFPPRPLNPPVEGKEEEAVPVQHGDRVMVDVLLPPEPPPQVQPDVDMEEEKKGEAGSTDTGAEGTSSEDKGMEVDSNTAALASALVSALSGTLATNLWEAACQNPSMFSNGGYYFNLVQNDLGTLKDDQHCTIPLLPGKVFAYSKTNDRLELCLGQVHIPVQPLSQETLDTAHTQQGSPRHEEVDSVMKSESSFSGVIHHRDSARSRLAFAGEGRSLSGAAPSSPRRSADEFLPRANQPGAGVGFSLPRTLRQPKSTTTATTTHPQLSGATTDAAQNDTVCLPGQATAVSAIGRGEESSAGTTGLLSSSDSMETHSSNHGEERMEDKQDVTRFEETTTNGSTESSGNIKVGDGNEMAIDSPDIVDAALEPGRQVTMPPNVELDRTENTMPMALESSTERHDDDINKENDVLVRSVVNERNPLQMETESAARNPPTHMEVESQHSEISERVTGNPNDSGVVVEVLEDVESN